MRANRRSEVLQDSTFLTLVPLGRGRLAASSRVWGQPFEESAEGQTHHSNRLSLVLLGYCLRAAKQIDLHQIACRRTVTCPTEYKQLRAVFPLSALRGAHATI